MLINHTQQTTRYNCGSAILAMILDTSIADIETNIARDPSINHGVEVKHINDGFAQIGIDGEEISWLLYQRNIPNIVVRHRDDEGAMPFYSSDREQFARTIPTTKEIFEWLFYDKRRLAVFGVESRVEEDLDHWILASCAMVMDPGEPAPKPWEDYADDPWKVNGPIILIEGGLQYMLKPTF